MGAVEFPKIENRMTSIGRIFDYQCAANNLISIWSLEVVKKVYEKNKFRTLTWGSDTSKFCS